MIIFQPWPIDRCSKWFMWDSTVCVCSIDQRTRLCHPKVVYKTKTSNWLFPKWIVRPTAKGPFEFPVFIIIYFRYLQQIYRITIARVRGRQPKQSSSIFTRKWYRQFLWDVLLLLLTLSIFQYFQNIFFKNVYRKMVVLTLFEMVERNSMNIYLIELTNLFIQREFHIPCTTIYPWLSVPVNSVLCYYKLNVRIELWFAFVSLILCYVHTYIFSFCQCLLFQTKKQKQPFRFFNLNWQRTIHK